MSVLIFSLFGLISGVATSLILRPIPFGTFSIWPGLLFGIAIALFFIWREKMRAWLKIIGFVLLSIASYYVAFQITYGSSISLSNYAPWLWYFLGGLAGALALSLCLSWLLHRLTLKQVIVFALLGGALGIVGYLVGSPICVPCHTIDMSGGGTGFNWLYVIWQTGMGIGFGWIASSKTPRL